MPRKTYKRIEAVKKVSDILQAIADMKDPATGQEIARYVEMPPGTVMCYLASLEDTGFVVSVGDRYKLGMRLAVIWARIRSNLEAEQSEINKKFELIGG